jgi:hypothetical protein
MMATTCHPLLITICIVFLALDGCCSASKPSVQQLQAGWTGPDTAGLTPPAFNADVVAVIDPPVGWKPEPLKSSDNHQDQVWLSSTGDTAYGVIYFKMPLPVGQDLAFSGFLSRMKKMQGEATLISREDDPKLPGIRFTAAGGKYVIRTNFIISGWEGWAVYAGTLKTGPIIGKELDLAIRAREHTQVGRPDNSGK